MDTNVSKSSLDIFVRCSSHSVLLSKHHKVCYFSWLRNSTTPKVFGHINFFTIYFIHFDRFERIILEKNFKSNFNQIGDIMHVIIYFAKTKLRNIREKKEQTVIYKLLQFQENLGKNKIIQVNGKFIKMQEIYSGVVKNLWLYHFGTVLYNCLTTVKLC